MRGSGNVTRPSELVNGWVSSPNGRGSYDIIWLCFFTVFVCTYVVLHLNVPALEERGHGQERRYKFWGSSKTTTTTTTTIILRKIKWMVLTIVVPEVVMASAFAQWTSARRSLQSMKIIGFGTNDGSCRSCVGKLRGSGEDCPCWTLRHAFYWNMGGLWIRLKQNQSISGNPDPGEFRMFPINAAQQRELITLGIMDLPKISAEEIWDKSKADNFAKLLACLQIAWLSIECICRLIQGLEISVLEIGTVGFALPSLASFAFWFNKPNGVETPTIVDLDLTLDDLLARLKCPSDFEWRDTPLDFLDLTSSVNRPSIVSEVVLKARYWPARKRFQGPARRIRNDVFALKYSKLDQVVVVLVFLGYGAIHIAAWNCHFPSRAEQMLWRISCLIMSGSMVFFWIAANRKFYLLFGYIWPSKMKDMEKISNERRRIHPIQIFLGAITGVAYLISRMCLIVEALVSLRAQPSGVYDTVDWMQIFPHI